MIRDLTELAISMVKAEAQERVRIRAEEIAEERLLERVASHAQTGGAT